MRTRPRGWTQEEYDAAAIQALAGINKISVGEAVIRHRRWLAGVLAERRAHRNRRAPFYAILHDFLKRNPITKKPCICGANRVHMHHPDYTEPFKVAFLCSRCHRLHHAGALNRPFEVYDVRVLALENLSLWFPVYNGFTRSGFASKV